MEFFLTNKQKKTRHPSPPPTPISVIQLKYIKAHNGSGETYFLNNFVCKFSVKIIKNIGFFVNQW